jgi:hypothetical protein
MTAQHDNLTIANRFAQSWCKLQADRLRTDSKAAANN